MGGRRNAALWVGVTIVIACLWFFAARVRLHLVDETTFILCVGVAAIALTALFWWGVRDTDDPNHPIPPNESE